MPKIETGASALGIAYHFLMQLAAFQGLGSVSGDDVKNAARIHGIKTEDLADLWENGKFDPIGGLVEHKVSWTLPSGAILVGHPDWVKLEDGRLTIIDYKTTARPENAIDVKNCGQLFGYAAAWIQSLGPVVTRLDLSLYYPNAVQGEQWETATYEGDAIQRNLAWITTVAEEAVAQYALPPERRSYRPSSMSSGGTPQTSCDWCDARGICPALRERMRQMFAMADMIFPDVPPMEWTDETFAEIWRKYEFRKILEKQRDVLVDALCEVIPQRGPISLGDKLEIRLHRQTNWTRDLPVVRRKEGVL